MKRLIKLPKWIETVEQEQAYCAGFDAALAACGKDIGVVCDACGATESKSMKCVVCGSKRLREVIR